MSSPLPISPAAALADEMANLRRHWWVFFALGLISLIVGFLALSCTFVATFATVQVIGIFLLVAGGAEVVHAIVGRDGRGFALHLLAAALYLLVGVYTLEHPLVAVEVLTFLLAASFLVGGALRIVFSLTTRFPAWPWVLLNGVVNIILGALILNKWPESALWVIGLFVGIDLIFHGWTWMFLALGVRSYTPPPQPA